MLNPVTPDFEARLRETLPAATFKEDTDGYFTESRARWHGHGLVVAPGCVEEVATVVKACASALIPIVPYSGGTGLVGSRRQSSLDG